MAYATELGSQIINGTLEVRDEATFQTHTRFNGNVVFANTSIIDMHSSTVYNFGDPLIYLNTTFTGPYTPQAGLRIFRGDFDDEALLIFSEDITRTTLEWRIGIGADLKRIGRIDDAMSARHAVYWNSTLGVTSTHPSITLNVAAIDSAIPFVVNIPAGGPSSRLIGNNTAAVPLSIERMDTGVTVAATRFGFSDHTVDGHSFVGIGRMTGLSSMLFSIDTPTHDRTRYIFDDCLTLGIDGTDTLLRSERASTTLEAATEVRLRTTAGAANIVTVNDTEVTVNRDLVVPNHEVDAYNVYADALAITSENHAIDVSIDPLPVIVGWPSTITQDGVTSTVSWANAQARTRYQVRLTYTISFGAAATTQIYTPVNVGGNLNNVRSFSVLSRQMSGGSVVKIYSPPMSGVTLEPPFQLDPTYLTVANMAGYHILGFQMLKVLGDWEVFVTIETTFPSLRSL